MNKQMHDKGMATAKTVQMNGRWVIGCYAEIPNEQGDNTNPQPTTKRRNANGTRPPRKHGRAKQNETEHRRVKERYTGTVNNQTVVGNHWCSSSVLHFIVCSKDVTLMLSTVSPRKHNNDECLVEYNECSIIKCTWKFVSLGDMWIGVRIATICGRLDKTIVQPSCYHSISDVVWSSRIECTAGSGYCDTPTSCSWSKKQDRRACQVPRNGGARRIHILSVIVRYVSEDGY